MFTLRAVNMNDRPFQVELIGHKTYSGRFLVKRVDWIPQWVMTELRTKSPSESNVYVLDINYDSQKWTASLQRMRLSTLWGLKCMKNRTSITTEIGTIVHSWGLGFGCAKSLVLGFKSCSDMTDSYASKRFAIMPSTSSVQIKTLSLAMLNIKAILTATWSYELVSQMMIFDDNTLNQLIQECLKSLNIKQTSWNYVALWLFGIGLDPPFTNVKVKPSQYVIETIGISQALILFC